MFSQALNGNAVTITDDKFSGMSLLCQEFRYREFGVQLSSPF
jgi:hypothetical protein